MLNAIIKNHLFDTISQQCYSIFNMKYFSLPAFEKTGLVRTVFTTSQNIAWKYGEEGCFENYSELGQSLGIKPDQMVKTIQKHTNKIRIVTKENAGEGVSRPISAEYDEYDGLITNEKKLLLCTVEADCVPVYLLDTEKKVIGMVHSGWKGTVKKISEVAIKLMVEKFACNSRNILVGLGPHICKECYEVGQDVYEEFAQGFCKEKELPDKIDSEKLNRIFYRKNDKKIEQKYLLNLEEAVKLTVMECGVPEGNISSAGYCTLHSEITLEAEQGKSGEIIRFCSYRRTKSPCERMLTAIMLV